MSFVHIATNATDARDVATKTYYARVRIATPLILAMLNMGTNPRGKSARLVQYIRQQYDNKHNNNNMAC